LKLFKSQIISLKGREVDENLGNRHRSCTEDILLYDDQKKSVENCVKMVLPSPSQVFVAKGREATRLCKDLFIKGDIIGGGAFSFALREHIEKGLRFR
jgi:uncharacterized protein (DUF1786 family)